MRPPKLIKPYVRRFCQRVEPGAADPAYIASRPLPNAPMRDCFVTVAQQVEHEGGDTVIGWAIWEWPKVLIEAEFHAVWRTPQGELVNITPYEVPIPRLLFLPSVRRRYEGRQVNNVREPLDRDPAIKRMIELYGLLFAELNRGELQYQHGEVAVRPEAARYQREIAAIQFLLHDRYGSLGAEEP